MAEEIRPLLNSFKNDLKNLNEDYYFYPTYNHTGVDVECCEAIVAASKNDRNEVKRKINFAKNRFELGKNSGRKEYKYLKITGEKVNRLYKLYDF